MDKVEKEVKQIWELLEEVFDPEVPVLTILDLGVVRNVQLSNNTAVITITPTYSGCPAMSAIEMDIRLKLLSAGYKNVLIKTVLSPAWTTDWMTEAGKKKLEGYGIAPPVEPLSNMNELFGREAIVRCPLCKSENTKLVSQFGSTACKALYQCLDCLEPFDYFKCLK